jgi:hypothetical protein
MCYVTTLSRLSPKMSVVTSSHRAQQEAQLASGQEEQLNIGTRVCFMFLAIATILCIVGAAVRTTAGPWASIAGSNYSLIKSSPQDASLVLPEGGIRMGSQA